MVKYYLPEEYIYHDHEISLIAEQCLKYREEGCWKEILRHRKSMYPLTERWVVRHLNPPSILSKRVLLLWQPKLALTIYLINYSRREKHLVDVVVQEH